MTTASDIFRDSVWSVLNGIHTALPGIIKSFDPATNKATIQPALNKNYASGVIAMPIIQNVPILFPKNIFFPISEGDYVLLIFSERSLDLWLSVGGQVTPDDPRKFDLSDAIAIPGLQPFTGNFSENNGNDYIISYAGSVIRIKDDGSIVIETGNTIAIGNQTTEVLDIISQLMSLLQGSTVMGTAFGGPLNPVFTAQVASIQAQIDALKGTIP